MKQKHLISDELDDVKPAQMDSDQLMHLLKGNKFHFSLNKDHVNEYLIEARKIAEKILKRSVVNIERGISTIEEHITEVSEPQYRSVFLMRLYQVAIEQVKPREVADLTLILFEMSGLLTKQQIRRGLVRLFWKLEDILLDVPNATQVLAQILQFLHVRKVVSPAGIITQMPKEVREKLTAIDSFKTHFQKELEKLGEEDEYKGRIKSLLQQYYINFDDSEITYFFSEEIVKKKWALFNHVFIRKAIDYALDKGPNEKEACSKLLYKLTHTFNFQNRDYGYAFDYLIWNHKEYEIDVP